MISPLLLQLIRQAEQEKIARDFWYEVNELAEKYEVSTDYILQEFYIFPLKKWLLLPYLLLALLQLLVFL